MILFVLKLTLLLVLGAAFALLLRNRSAATRHLVWSMTLIGALLLAVLASVGPTLSVPILQAPRESATAEAAVATFKPLASNVDPAFRHPEPAHSLRSGQAVRGEGSQPTQVPGIERFFTRTSLAALWLTGFVAMLAWTLLGHLGLGRIARKAKPVIDPAMIAEAVAQSGVTRPVQVATSESVNAPLTWGWARPQILLPADAASWPADRLRAALMHELAHVARNDYLIQLFAGFACAFYWFHPVAWLALRNLRRESEQASDDHVIARGIIAPDYASHLVDVAVAARARRFGGLLVLSMACPSHLETRLRALLDETRARNVVSRRWISAAVVVSLLLLLPLAAARPEARATTRVDTNVEKPIQFAMGFDRVSRAVTRPISRAFRRVDRLANKFGQSPQNAVPLPERMIAASPGETLILDLETGGSVELRGWDEPRVAVDVQLGGPDGADTRADVERVAEGVRVHAAFAGSKSSRSTSNAFSIRVPRRFNLRLNSSGGSVSISDVEGTFEGSTGGGGFQLQRLKGRANLSTGGGEIDVDDVDLDGQVSTGGGGVTLNNVRGNLNGSSGSEPLVRRGGGDVTTFMEDDGRGHVKSGGLRIRKAGGRVDFGDAPDGVSIHTGGGAVTVGRAAGMVEATTGGGPIKVGPVAGSVFASTGAGRVDISLADARGATQTVEVFTGKGDVSVALPSGFDGRFEIETAFTDEKEPTRIDSVWELDHQPHTDWDASVGTPRRFVRATGVAGNGRGLIKIKAVNGNVSLRRAR